VTGQALRSAQLVPNLSLRDAIRLFLSESTTIEEEWRLRQEEWRLEEEAEADEEEYEEKGGSKGG
jgi:hypothetical protein